MTNNYHYSSALDIFLGNSHCQICYLCIVGCLQKNLMYPPLCIQVLENPGGSGMVARYASRPPFGQILFYFHTGFGKKMAPLQLGFTVHVWEILDPPQQKSAICIRDWLLSAL